MTQHQFLRGVGIGVVAGAAIGMALAPKRKSALKHTAEKALKTMGEVAENISHAMTF